MHRNSSATRARFQSHCVSVIHVNRLTELLWRTLTRRCLKYIYTQWLSRVNSHLIMTRRHVAHAGMDAPASALQSQDYLSPAAPQYNFADKETNCESAVATPNNTLSIRDQRSTATHEYSWPIDSQLTNGNWSEGGQSLTVTYCYWERKYQGAKVPSMVLSLLVAKVRENESSIIPNLRGHNPTTLQTDGRHSRSTVKIWAEQEANLSLANRSAATASQAGSTLCT